MERTRVPLCQETENVVQTVARLWASDEGMVLLARLGLVLSNVPFPNAGDLPGRTPVMTEAATASAQTAQAAQAAAAIAAANAETAAQAETRYFNGGDVFGGARPGVGSVLSPERAGRWGDTGRGRLDTAFWHNRAQVDRLAGRVSFSAGTADGVCVCVCGGGERTPHHTALHQMQENRRNTVWEEAQGWGASRCVTVTGFLNLIHNPQGMNITDVRVLPVLPCVLW